MNQKFKEFLLFQRLITPIVIQIAFWVGVLLSIAFCILLMLAGEFLKGIGVLIVGPIIARFITEAAIVVYRINTTLTEIKQFLTKAG